MITKLFIFSVLYLSCVGQLAEHLFPDLARATRVIGGELTKNPILDFASNANGNAIANVVDVFTQVPFALARSLPTTDPPQLFPNINTVEYADRILADFNAVPYNEDASLDIEALAIKYGFPVEKHHVITDDGYVLGVFRIPGNGSVVFLMHGLLGSADDFVIAGPESGIAYLLAREGYDVWMGNNRGNKHSRTHTNLKPSDAAFWDFSFNEIGQYDLPAMIDYVLAKTEQKTLKYVGHSQGTTSFFVMTAEKPEYNHKISVMIALSPVAYMSHIRSPMVKILAPGTNALSGIFKSIGVYEFLPDNNMMSILKLAICGNGPVAELFCSNVMFLSVGFDLGQLNVTNLPVLFGHMPAGASTKQFIHYGQGVLSGDFRKFDYGVAENLKKYGQVTPPSYNLDNIVTPIAMFYSQEDWLSHYLDVEQLYAKLNSVIDIHKIPYQYFNHLDYMFAKDVKTLVYERLRKILSSY